MTKASKKGKLGWKLTAVGALICLGGLASCASTSEQKSASVGGDVKSLNKIPRAADETPGARVEPPSERLAAKDNSPGAAYHDAVAQSDRNLKAVLAEWDKVSGLDDSESIKRKLVKLRGRGPGFTAVLINGDSSSLHKFNLLTAFETLRKMGHEDERIVVLSRNFSPSSRYGRGSGSITAASSLRNVRAVFGALKETCTPDDTVFVYTTGHGDYSDEAGVCLMLDYEVEYPAREFGNFVGGLKSKFISVMDQCYSGGMVEAIPASRPNTIAISSAPPDKETCCKYFARAFWKSIQDPRCDGNGDGVVSIKEAYAIAIREHKRRVTWTSTDGVCHIRPQGAVLMPRLR